MFGGGSVILIHAKNLSTFVYVCRFFSLFRMTRCFDGWEGSEVKLNEE